MNSASKTSEHSDRRTAVCRRSSAIPIGIATVHLRLRRRCKDAFRDPRLVHQLIRLWHELADDAPASRLFADHVMRMLLETLARRTGSRVPPRQGRERLSNHTLRRLRDYVETSLADDLDVPMMADVVRLSPAHFARAFAATVGMTPFRYVMTRRLARARELLERTQRSALDIALDVGFKTPSHFTSRFRREFGVTPRAIRPTNGPATILHSPW
jgi:AraC family transcriptional regulator